jgi:hypothetical protein
MLLGLLLVVVGAWVAWGPRVPWLGRLPGDISIGGPNWRFYLPLATCLLLSLILTLLLRLFTRDR